MRHQFLITTLLALACATPAFAAKSRTSGGTETGLHKLHDIAPVGKGRVCMTSHEHVGESLPSGTLKVAKILATKNWINFTAEEYGRPWGNISIAAGKKETCTGSPGSFVCTVIARPCKAGR